MVILIAGDTRNMVILIAVTYKKMKIPVTQYLHRIELTYCKWGASATDITSVIGSGVLLLA
jgi:hypothetical protein